MKQFFALLLLFPAFGIAQKNLISTNRVFPKVDKVLEFEKALAAHAQKYHKGDYAWRVFEITSGPDAGGYHITEGPTSWETYDTRGNLGAEHNTDYNKSVAIYLTDRGSSGYSVFQEDASTIGLTDWADKIVISHNYPKPGRIGDAMEVVRRLKPMWTASDEKIAVYTASHSGPPQIIMVTRLKNGLKELQSGFRKPFPERFEAANGPESFRRYIADYEEAIEHRWSEILFYRADLSSK
ncbi:MAG TPA: hypothetical protein VGD17_07560 [Chitinophagaceae bacterium]